MVLAGVMLALSAMLLLPGAARADEHGGEAEQSPGDRYEPVVKEMLGWTVYIQPTLIDGEHQKEGEKALAMLEDHLRRIAVLVEQPQLKRLRKVEIWIEQDHPELGAMQYHPSLGWLKRNGHDPRLAKKVHVTNASSLLSRQQMIKHPWVILHELAHGYHHQYLGFDDPRIKSGYKTAMEKGLYDEVMLYTGATAEHYATTDHKEYFAESTEAYLARNDFYPFVRAELKEHDPQTHKLMKEIWGPVN
jgi:dipeptidyl-peptidase-4